MPDEDLDRVEPDGEQLDEVIDPLLLPGFTTEQDLVDVVTEWFADDSDDLPAFRRRVEDHVHARWRARLDEQRTWPAGTSQYELLRDAFTALHDEHGFAVGSAAGVDQSDGFRIVRDGRTPDPESPDGFREWAYVFFHEQDAEGLTAPGAVLRLAFGAFRPSPDLGPDAVARAALSERGRTALAERSRAVAGDTVVSVLVEHGLEAVWTGDGSARIRMSIDRWRKPLPGSD